MSRSRFVILLLQVLVLGLLGACASDEPAAEKKDYARPLGPGESALELVTDPAQYPDFRAMWADRDNLELAIDRSIAWFGKPSSKRHYPFQQFSHERVLASLQRMKEILGRAQDEREFSGYVQLDYDVYRSVGWNREGEVLFTAYYQPIFAGSRERSAAYPSPLYRMPDDLVKAEDGTPLGRRDGEQIVSYWTRRELEDGRLLDGKGLELVWLQNPLDAFIIHVQGSAKIRLPDGNFMYVGYKAKTDRPYTSIGKELVKDGKIPADQLSLARIRAYFAAHPEEQQEYLDRNESFVFFTESDGGGPYGSLGAPVTAYRSIATDKSIFPRGALCAVETTVPRPAADGRLEPQPFVQMVLDQDTGGAIRSAGRCDIFVGTGDGAERIAGHTNHEGRLFYLFVKERNEEPRP
ncbi:MAG: MltA domain-containing protein [Planctomycetes bacterium]|nr:MltA domain-containing protein [Planctomycetota bacterium]